MSGVIPSSSSNTAAGSDGGGDIDTSQKHGASKRNRLVVVSDDEEEQQGSHVNVAFEPDGRKAPTMNNNVGANGGTGGDGSEFHTYLEEIVSIPDPNSTVRYSVLMLVKRFRLIAMKPRIRFVDLQLPETLGIHGARLFNEHCLLGPREY